MAFLASLAVRPHSHPAPVSGWDLASVEALVGPQPTISEFKTEAGTFYLIRSKQAQALNLAASMETGLLLKGDVLIVPPGETIVRSQS